MPISDRLVLVARWQEREPHTQQRRSGEEPLGRQIQDDVHGQDAAFAIGASLSFNDQGFSVFENGSGPAGGAAQRGSNSIESKGAGCHIADGDRNRGAPFQHERLQEELRAVQETVSNLGQMTLSLQQQEQYQRLELRLQQLQLQLT